MMAMDEMAIATAVANFSDSMKMSKSSMALQLWMHRNGYLIKAKHVLDIAGSNLTNGTQIDNPVATGIRHRGHQPAVDTDRRDDIKVQLLEKKTGEHSEQHWGFLIFGKRKVKVGATITTTKTEKVNEVVTAQTQKVVTVIATAMTSSPGQLQVNRKNPEFAC
ncbi:hypothetical protein BC936DRAFT_144896 [Jimgerdemannia flammicorona]|uniref:Uncharacterized protein n=1 Tax=Jimgerdemannia flammicorona TaxID=994334 RepID=A0A433DBD8_9FUNG|nr:hypothetical protein BC936DRAFT_144896 [Jimgerdemannia flammicorona]